MTEIIIDFEEDDVDFYISELRCQRCDMEMSHEEDNNNLGLCDECYKTNRL